MNAFLSFPEWRVEFEGNENFAEKVQKSKIQKVLYVFMR